MCRYQLPGWQEFYAAHQNDNFELLSIAVDAPGAKVAKPWHDKAHATFTTVVDQTNLLAGAFGFKVVPNGLMIDANGILRFKQIGGFSIDKAETRQQVESLIREKFGDQNPAPLEALQPPSAAGESWQQHFQTAVRLIEQGQHKEAAAALRRALLRDPTNFLVRKQLWRALHPEKFGEQIDLDWQQQQRQREAELGFEAANPV